MEKNEEQVGDVRLATPVEDEVKKGQKNKPAAEEANSAQRNVGRGLKDEPKKKAPDKDGDCETKKRIISNKEPKRRTVNIFEKECKPPKSNPIPRHCISKKEHLNILSSPRPKCPPPCLQKTVTRKLAPVSPRILELAKPTKQRILRTIADGADTLAPELLDNLLKMLEAKSSLSPEQAARLFRDKKCSNKKRRKKKEKKKRKDPTNKEKAREEQKKNCEPPGFDPEAVCCQYQMAEKFVKSILDWKCPVQKEEFQDIAEVILRRLSNILEYTPGDNGDRRSQQMRFLADVISCWITGVLIEAAEIYGEGKGGEEDEDTEEEEDDILSEEVDDEEEDDDDDEEDEEEEPEEQETATQTVEEPEVTDQGTDADAQLGEKEDEEPEEEPEEEKPEEPEEEKLEEKEEEPGEEKPEEPQEEKPEEPEEEKPEEPEEEKPEESKEEKPEEPEEEKEEEPEEERAAEPEEKEPEEPKEEEAEEPEEPEEEEIEEPEEEEPEEDEDDLEKPLSHSTSIETETSVKSLQTDVPFITFPQIFDTIYKTMDDEEENTGEDPMVNRIHRAVYEKCRNAVMRENPELLTDNVNDIIDVMAGKVAVWLSKALTDSQVLLLNKYPPQVESFEVRDWSKWLNDTTKTAKNWTTWLQSLIKEAQKMKEGKVTKGQWEEWTKKLDANAALWRRFHLDTLHHAHHNAMMIKDREVVKTGEKTIPELEKEIRTVDL